MCGRYYLRKAPKAVRNNALPPDWSDTKIDPFKDIERFNIAPSQTAPVARLVDGELTVEELRWGFLPQWMAAKGKPQINARSETVFEKPMFRAAAKSQRCVVPATGWFEWQPVAGGKQPWAFEPNELVAFAGLWTCSVNRDGEPENNYLILTTEASPIAARIHNRMPVILSAEQWMPWVQDGARELLRPYDGPLDAWKVTPRMGSPRFNGPECVERIA